MLVIGLLIWGHFYIADIILFEKFYAVTPAHCLTSDIL